LLHSHFDVTLPPLSSGYTLKKIQENNEAEIMGVVSEEARESYAPELVVELASESTEDIESNVARIIQWIENWRRDRGFEDSEEG
jgi:adenylate kinase